MPAWLLETAAVVVILAGALALRLWRLGELPPGIDLDQARSGMEAVRVLAGQHPMMFTTYDPREPAFLYSLALAIAWFGRTVYAVQMAGLWWGILGVALTYPVARQWFGRKVALLATAGMAVSLWDLIASRWDGKDTSMVPALLLFLFFFWRALDEGSLVNFGLTGVFLSLTAYTYVAARIIPLLVVLLLACEWPIVKTRLKGLVLALATAVLTVAPLAIWFLRNPDQFTARAARITSLAAPEAGVAPDTVWQTTVKTLGMYFVHGDVNWRDNISGWPVFAPLLAAFFCLGIVWSLAHLYASAKRVQADLCERPTAARLHPCLWLLLWQAILLIPAFLARPSPQFDRTIGTAPSTYVLLALGLAGAAAFLARTLPKLTAPASLAAGLAIAVSGAQTAQAYFVGPYATSGEPGKVYQQGQAFDAAYLNQRAPDPAHTVIVLGYQSSTAIHFLAPQYDGAIFMEDFSRLLPLPATAGATTYLFASPSLPITDDLPTAMARYFPEASPDASQDFNDHTPAARIYQVHPFDGPARAIDKPIGDGVQLVSASVTSTEAPAQPGQPLRLTLRWRVLKEAHNTFDAFIHVVNANGKLITQDDLQGLPTLGWHPGQEFLSAHVITLPAGTPAGRYTVLAGIDRRTYDQPSTSLGELGAQVPVLTLIVN
ncbi:MAG: glycosyltransferase family 39 protein [Chloroflexi bacterium]|nr:glycosyltransferase family 39 protein [Chloroflexota bacterium]